MKLSPSWSRSENSEAESTDDSVYDFDADTDGNEDDFYLSALKFMIELDLIEPSKFQIIYL